MEADGVIFLSFFQTLSRIVCVDPLTVLALKWRVWLGKDSASLSAPFDLILRYY